MVANTLIYLVSLSAFISAEAALAIDERTGPVQRTAPAIVTPSPFEDPIPDTGCHKSFVQNHDRFTIEQIHGLLSVLNEFTPQRSEVHRFEVKSPDNRHLGFRSLIILRVPTSEHFMEQFERQLKISYAEIGRDFGTMVSSGPTKQPSRMLQNCIDLAHCVTALTLGTAIITWPEVAAVIYAYHWFPGEPGQLNIWPFIFAVGLTMPANFVRLIISYLADRDDYDGYEETQFQEATRKFIAWALAADRQILNAISNGLDQSVAVVDRQSNLTQRSQIYSDAMTLLAGKAAAIPRPRNFANDGKMVIVFDRTNLPALQYDFVTELAKKNGLKRDLPFQ